MPTAVAIDPITFRLGALYAAYFGLAGVLAPYMPLYFQARGLSAFEIGVLIALGQAMRVVSPHFWGYLADHAARRTSILRSAAVGLLVALSLLLIPGGFVYVFAVMVLVNLFQTGQMPIAEALASARMRDGRDAAGRYGRLRLWGSAGFITVVMAAGPLFDRAGIETALWLSLALAALLLFVTWQVQDERIQEAAHERVSVGRRLREASVRWFLLSAALMVFAHGALYSYLSIYLAQLGYSKTAIGIYWALSIVLEIAFFFTQGRWFTRFGVYALLQASFLAAAVRFLLIAEMAVLWWVLAFAQTLHAFSFAVHHSASVLMIQRWFPGRAAARGQAVYISAAWGAGGTAGTLVAAYAWTLGGAHLAFGAGSAAALLGAWALRKARRLDAGWGGPHPVT